MVGTHGLSGRTQFVVQPRFFLHIDYIIRQYDQEVFGVLERVPQVGTPSC